MQTLHEWNEVAKWPSGASLWQGSAPDVTQPVEFDAVALCAVEYQPASKTFRSPVYVLHVPLDDAQPSADEIKTALRAGRRVRDLIRQGQRVLVTCHAGMNRSGWVAGLALLELGVPIDEALSRIRRARAQAARRIAYPRALHNDAFVEILHLHAAKLARQKTRSRAA